MSDQRPLTLEGAAIERANRAKDDRRLRVVDGETIDSNTGEIVCPECAAKDLVIEGLEETARSQGAKITALRRDRAAEARGSDLWPQALEAFRYWQEATGHGRTRFSTDRFELLRPYLKQDGLEMVKLAIDGAAFNPYTADRPNRNGHLEVYDGLETIFKNRGAFERHVARAPRDRLREVRKSGGFPRPSQRDLRIKAEVILTLMPADRRTPAERAEAALTRAAQSIGIKLEPYFYDPPQIAAHLRRVDEIASGVEIPAESIEGEG